MQLYIILTSAVIGQVLLKLTRVSISFLGLSWDWEDEGGGNVRVWMWVCGVYACACVEHWRLERSGGLLSRERGRKRCKRWFINGDSKDRVEIILKEAGVWAGVGGGYRKGVFFFFNRSIVALQCCVSFCYTVKWISYMYTHIPVKNQA